MKLTLKELEQWVDNDEGLYLMWKASRLAKRRFVKENREFIAKVVTNMCEGRKPTHYLAYGGGM